MPRPLPPVREFWLADDDPPPGPAPGPCPSLRPSPALRSWVWVGFVQSVSGVKGCPEGMCPARWVWSWTDAVRMPRRTGTRARSVTNQSSPFSKGGFATWEKGAADKKSPARWTRSVRTAHPVRAGARAVGGPATARRPPSPRRGLLLHGGPPFVHHRCSRRSIDSAAFVRAKFLCVSTLVGAGHESLRAKLPRPSMC